MALQVGVSAAKLIVLLGAGLTGTVLVQNGHLPDFLFDISRVVSKHIREVEGGGGMADAATIKLKGELSRLQQELERAMSSSDAQVMVIGGPPSSSGNITSLVPVVVVGAAGYGYFRWRGWSLSDFMYVTKRHMTSAISEVSKQFDQVSAALATTRRHLTMRIEDVSKALQDSAEMQGVIKNEVLDIRNDVAKCGGDVQVVQQMVEGLELKIGEVQSKQDFANKGILLLCQYVQGLESGQAQLLETREKLQLLQLPKPQLPAPTSSSASSSSSKLAPSPSGGLKELQQISETLESLSTESGGSPAAAASSAPRTLRPTFSIDLQRFKSFR